MADDLNTFRRLRVLVTGHTGFKGAWLCLLLSRLGASVLGISLDPPSIPNLFTLAGLNNIPPKGLNSSRADILDLPRLIETVSCFVPDVVIHMAAQALVRTSYSEPVPTFAANVLGTANVLEACRINPPAEGNRRAIVIITSDKCYENREWLYGYREVDRMGGHDPYSASKGCAELVTASYLRSFFAPEDVSTHRTVLATARAGNVIGGGDFAADRLVPDMARAFSARKPVIIRRPEAVRPWQHVLEPVTGYLLLAERMLTDGARMSGAWNFGPDATDVRTVGEVASRFALLWGDDAVVHCTPDCKGPHEAGFLTLDCAKARALLGWKPRLELNEALSWTASWYKAWAARQNDEAGPRAMALEQIEQFLQLAALKPLNAHETVRTQEQK